MSEITETHAAWVPPPFPPQGRLPGRALQVGQNCHQQNSDERRYHQELCLAAGRRVEPPCCKTLHISLFFDGSRFFALYTDIYLFNRLIIILQPTGERLEWEEKHSRRIPG